MSGYRIDRASEDIRREMTAIIRELKDPRVKDKLLTVVRVEVNSDLSCVKAYVSSIKGISDAAEAVNGLKSAAGFIRREIGNRLHMRKAPEIKFIADDSVEQGIEIFKKVKTAPHN